MNQNLVAIETHFQKLLMLEEANEILCNGPGSLFLSTASEVINCDSVFSSHEEMTLWMQDYAFSLGLRLDPLFPCNGGMDISKKFRWHGVLKEVAPEGPLFVYRKLFRKVFSLNDFILSDFLASKIEALFKNNYCILFSGATSSGKTSLLSACLNQYCLQERVVILESHQELLLSSKLWCRLVEPDPDRDKRELFDLQDLLRHTLRLKPDRLVLGEIRGLEASAFFEAALSGHESCVATIHADTPEQALLKLKRLCLGNERHHSETQWAEFLESVPLAVVQMARGRQPIVKKVAIYCEKHFIETMPKTIV